MSGAQGSAIYQTFISSRLDTNRFGHLSPLTARPLLLRKQKEIVLRLPASLRATSAWDKQQQKQTQQCQQTNNMNRPLQAIMHCDFLYLSLYFFFFICLLLHLILTTERDNDRKQSKRVL